MKKASFLLVFLLSSAIIALNFDLNAIFPSRSGTSLQGNIDSSYQNIRLSMAPPANDYYIQMPRPVNHILILTPSNSSSWNTGSYHAITWLKNGSASFVNLYLEKDFYYVFRIATGVQNTGSYNWSIPSPLSTGDDYEIMIEDYENSSCEGWSPNFSIVDINYITNPSSNTSWIAGLSYLIKWTTSNDSSYVAIYLYNNNSYVWTIAYRVSGNGTYRWSIPAELFTSSTYEISIVENDLYYGRMSSSNFTIIGNTYRIKVISPSMDSTWFTGAYYYIQWANDFNIASVNIELYSAGSPVLTIDHYYGVQGSYYPSYREYPCSWQYYWHVPSSLLTGNSYRIKIVDAKNSSCYAYSSYFTISSMGIGNYAWVIVPIVVVIAFLFIGIAIAVKHGQAKHSPKPRSPISTPVTRTTARVYCPQCGTALNTSFRYCPQCGARQP